MPDRKDYVLTVRLTADSKTFAGQDVPEHVQAALIAGFTDGVSNVERVQVTLICVKSTDPAEEG